MGQGPAWHLLVLSIDHVALFTPHVVLLRNTVLKPPALPAEGQHGGGTGALYLPHGPRHSPALALWDLDE